MIQKYKRKKRFGRSNNRRAPASFLLELERKVEAVGGVYAEVDTKEFKARGRWSSVRYSQLSALLPLTDSDTENGAELDKKKCNKKQQKRLKSNLFLR